MKLNLKQAWENIFNTDNWKLKVFIYTVLYAIVLFQPNEDKVNQIKTAGQSNPDILLAFLILSFTYGILNSLASFFTQGYLARYLHNLIIKKDSELPKWENFKNLFVIGIKPILAILIVAIPIFLISTLIYNTVKLPFIVYDLFILLNALIFGIWLFFSGALYLTYIQNFKMWDSLNFKKAKKYIGKEYIKYIIITSFISVILVGITTILSTVCEILSYILVVIIAPFLGLWITNILAQLHHIQVAKYTDTAQLTGE